MNTIPDTMDILLQLNAEETHYLMEAIAARMRELQSKPEQYGDLLILADISHKIAHLITERS